jgi:hypothetical protein
MLLGQTSPPDLKRAEERMRKRPGDALRIARELAADVPPDSAEYRALFSKAAEITLQSVARLSKDQAAELANLYSGTLGDAAAAKRVQEDWLNGEARLAGQELPPGPARAQKRVELARLWLTWVNNQKEAANLCLQALADQANSPEAIRILRDELHYRLEGGTWVAATPDKETGKQREIQPGMTPADVRKALGHPNRISRQVLYRRLLEQWTYDRPEPFVVEIDFPRGQDARVLTVLRPAGKP